MPTRALLGALVSSALFFSIPLSASAATEVTADITSDTHWTFAGSPYVVHFDNDEYFPHVLLVAPGVTLTIDPGVVIKFAAYNGILIKGSLSAGGTVASPVTFTSLEDDTAAGDTNGDGGATAPTDKQWMHLEFSNGSSGTLAYATVRYGGARQRAVANTGIANYGGTLLLDHVTLAHNADDGLGQHGGHTTLTNSDISDQTVGITMNGGTLDVSDTHIHDNWISGIDRSWDSVLSITRSEIDHNDTGILARGHGSISVTSSSIHDNTTLGVDNETQAVGYDENDNPFVTDPGISINARNNWWGSANEPSSAVSGDVAYTPWLTSNPVAPATCTPSATCASNVLFLPGIEGSRLYKPDGSGADRLWEPNIDSDVRDLYLNPDGSSARNDIYAKEGDVIDELPDGENIYKSFIAKMNGLKTGGTINDWEPIAYDWRLSLDDLLNYGNDVNGRI